MPHESRTAPGDYQGANVRHGHHAVYRPPTTRGVPAMNTRRLLCPTPTKTSFLSRETAERALGRMPVLYGPVAAYECRCGRWHLTSRERYDDEGWR
jgi:hypothetical protein